MMERHHNLDFLVQMSTIPVDLSDEFSTTNFVKIAFQRMVYSSESKDQVKQSLRTTQKDLWYTNYDCQTAMYQYLERRLKEDYLIDFDYFSFTIQSTFVLDMRGLSLLTDVFRCANMLIFQSSLTAWREMFMKYEDGFGRYVFRLRCDMVAL